MAGQLQSYPLTELIREIYAGGLSGALRLARERAKAVIYFDAGEIIYAASNLRAFRLLESVRRWNILSEEQLAGVQGKAADLEFGAALVETGALSPEQLNELMTRQVSELLYHALLWTDGDWDFDPRVRLASGTRVAIKAKKLLVESARRLPSEAVRARFTNKSEQLFPEAQTPDDLDLLPTEAFVLSRIDVPLSINELLAIGGLPEAETLHVVYTLALGGFLRRERWPQALSAEELAKAQALTAASSRQETHAAAPVSATEEPKIESRDRAEAKTVTSEKTAAPEEPRDEQAELEAFFKRLSISTDYYQQLGVRRSANVAEIKRAYYALAKRFHPDRFRRESDAARLASIESAFAQVAQAYETLKDNGSRAVYDSRLLKQEQEERTNRAAAAARTHAGKNQRQGEPEASQDFSFAKAGSQAATYEAEERFQQGLSALHQGNHAFAIAALGDAARLEPNEPRYRAFFGQALASDERLRRNAEAELKAAIALDANNTSYRLMLAELYSRIGLVKRAQSELDRVLAAEPRNDAAQRLRDKLKRG